MSDTTKKYTQFPAPLVTRNRTLASGSRTTAQLVAAVFNGVPPRRLQAFCTGSCRTHCLWNVAR